MENTLLVNIWNLKHPMFLLKDGQVFPAGTFFSGAHVYPGTEVYTFTGNGIIFGDGSAISFITPTTFGKNADFSAGPK